MSGLALKYATKIVDGGVFIIEVAGEIDLYNSARLRNHFKALRMEGAKKFIFDFSATEYMDSSGIGLLVYFHTSSRQRNIRLAFVNFSPPVTKLLRMTRLESVLPVTRGLGEVLSDFRRQSTAEPSVKRIGVNGRSPLFDTTGMEKLELNVKLDQVRRLSLLIAQKAPPENRETNLLEQQVSELIKNAVKHGNRCHPDKKVRIWYSLTDSSARLIVEDEGDGFLKLEEWNDFYDTKTRFHLRQDYDSLLGYLSFRTEQSDQLDGGNALFAAVEYWNQGVVFNEKRNAVAVKRCFYH